VHPFTSPTATVESTEGLNSTLRLYFPVVGITYRTVLGLPSLQFNSRINLVDNEDITVKSGYTYVPVGNTPSTRFDPTDSTMWYLFVWQSNKQFIARQKPTMYTKNLTNIWLGMYNHNENANFEDTMVFIFVYGSKGLTGLPKGIRSNIYKVTVGQIDEFNRNHNNTDEKH
jgi:hypothetical protein